MKKLLLAIMLLALTFTFVGCKMDGKEEKAAEKAKVETVKPAEKAEPAKPIENKEVKK